MSLFHDIRTVIIVLLIFGLSSVAGAGPLHAHTQQVGEDDVEALKLKGGKPYFETTVPTACGELNIHLWALPDEFAKLCYDHIRRFPNAHLGNALKEPDDISKDKQPRGQSQQDMGKSEKVPKSKDKRSEEVSKSKSKRKKDIEEKEGHEEQSAQKEREREEDMEEKSAQTERERENAETKTTEIATTRTVPKSEDKRTKVEEEEMEETTQTIVNNIQLKLSELERFIQEHQPLLGDPEISQETISGAKELFANLGPQELKDFGPFLRTIKPMIEKLKKIKSKTNVDVLEPIVAEFLKNVLAFALSTLKDSADEFQDELAKMGRTISQKEMNEGDVSNGITEIGRKIEELHEKSQLMDLFSHTNLNYAV